jgi:uncharacterized protein
MRRMTGRFPTEPPSRHAGGALGRAAPVGHVCAWRILAPAGLPRPMAGTSRPGAVGGVLNALDPRAPFVVDTRDLGRRAGAMKDLHLVVPAGSGWGSGLARVPEGSDLDLDLRLESVVEGVLVSGTSRARIDAECARCLEPFSWEEHTDIQELFVYPPQDARGHRIEEAGGDDEDAPPVIEDDLIDLEATVRDAVVLRLPIAPLCQEDCPGLCVECGALLAQDPGHRHEARDPRWAALGALLAGDAQQQEVQALVRDTAHDDDKDD